MSDVIRSKEFDDVYFSVEDGLAESRHVFLDGNNLPDRFEGKKNFVIAETGFGTGLNFLSAWEEFEVSGGVNNRLHFLSFEKYPLSVEEIRKALSKWNDELGDKIERMLDIYPLRIPGVHRIYVTDRVVLTLVFDDINEAIHKIDAKVDAWFLDGFSPAKNPQMWSDIVFENMARLSCDGATFSTFTSSGFVKRGLRDVGFDVAKREGFGWKRESLHGVIKKDNDCLVINNSKNVAIIGAGLAGCSSSYVLRKRGIRSVVFEAGDNIASGASGNICGLYNPRISALRNAESDFYMSAFSDAYNLISDIEGDVEFNSCGNFHLLNDDKKKKRFVDCLNNWGWHENHMKVLPAEKVSYISGVEVEEDGLLLSDAGSVSPKKLCEEMARGNEVRLSTLAKVDNLDGRWFVNGEEFDAVIFACGIGVSAFKETSWLPVYTVRGQVSVIEASDKTSKLSANIGYGGYISAEFDGKHVVGASFDRHNDDLSLLDSDNVENLGDLSASIKYFDEKYTVIDAKAGLRCSSDDYFPIIGRLPDYSDWKNGGIGFYNDLYVSTAHGSHGIVSSIAGANIIADMICGDVLSEYSNVRDGLCASRFLKRMRKREQL